MARRPRQTAKGTTAKNRTGNARTTPHCLWSIREKDQKPTVPTRRLPRCQPGPVMSPTGDTKPWLFGPGMFLSGDTRPREHEASPDPRFLVSCPHRLLANNRRKLLSLRPKGQGALSCSRLTRGAILPLTYGYSVQLIGLEVVVSPLARRAVSVLLPAPLWYRRCLMHVG